MKLVHLFLVVCIAILLCSCLATASTMKPGKLVIPPEFENIDVDNYLKNKNAVKFQLKCILDNGPCDRIGKWLKQAIPELMRNDCRNCDASQKKKVGKIVAHIQEEYPLEWEEARIKYDV